ncbi:MAG: hypothetical protein H6686_06725 [Fibrobacteria bacterium]|nr:hypothetical protein [Fibrobacteria bacterium]
MIPHTIHFVWSGERFPWAFSLAVRSAIRLHPGWRVVVHTGVEPRNSPGWDDVRALAEIRPIDPEAVLGALPEVGGRLVELHRAIAPRYHAGRSNLVRLAVLSTEGGWYLDFDTLTIASLEDLSERCSAVVGEEWVWAHDEERVAKGYNWTMVPSTVAFGASWVLARLGLPPDSRSESFLRGIWGRRELNNAVLACEPGHAWVGRLLDLATRQDPSVRFGLGPALVNLAWRSPEGAPLPTRLGPEAFYQFPPSQTNRYFRSSVLPEGARILHWCSSNHRDEVSRMDAAWIRRHSRSSPWAAHARSLLETSP